MKKLLIGIMVLVLYLSGIVLSDAAAPKSIVGAQGECEIGVGTCGASFPTSASILCDGTAVILDCPQFFHPDWITAGTRFFGVTNRVSPPRYVVSTDGGSTFGLITTQPFTAAVLNFGGKVAVASDGSWLAAAGQGTDLCIIRKSTDQGVSWSTVFTSLVENCSVGFAFPTAPGMHCASSGGYCAVVNPFNAVTVTVIFSTDNGSTWTVGVAYTDIAANSTTFGPALTDDASGGIISRGSNSTGVGQPFGVGSGGDFVATSNFVPPVNLNCRPLVMGSDLRTVCAPNAGGATFRLVGNTAPPIVLKTLTIPDILGTNNEALVIGFSSDIGYLIVPSAAFITTRLNVFITSDNWTSVVLLNQIIPATAYGGACCRGNIVKWQGRIYFSSGSVASQAFLAVIQ